MNDCHSITSNAQEMPFLPVMAYVPRQTLTTVFEAERGFLHGTLFPEIYKPFKGGCKNG